MSKSICDNCIKDCCWRAPSGGLDPPVITCTDFILKSQTNADKIFVMTVEQLLEFLTKCNACLRPDIRTEDDCNKYYNCKQCWLSWLLEVE